jgi:hypothetical protein
MDARQRAKILLSPNKLPLDPRFSGLAALSANAPACFALPNRSTSRLAPGMFAAQILMAEPAARTDGAYLPRFRALALFERRLPERVARSSLPASENLHKNRL